MKKKMLFVLICLLVSVILVACSPSQAEPHAQAAELPTLPAGWRDYAANGFHIALPKGWEAVDLGEEGVEAIMNSLAGINTDWARNMATMFTTEAMQEMTKFWAMDSKPAGTGYATINIVFQSQPFPVRIQDLCEQIPSAYEQIGMELVDAECGLEINDLEAARFVIRLQMGPLAVKEYQYAYGREGDMWMLTLCVDETKWSEYEPLFAAIAESFRVD